MATKKEPVHSGLTRIEKFANAYSHSAQSTITDTSTLRHRVLIYFGIGVLASGILFLTDTLLFSRHELLQVSRFATYHGGLFFVHPASFLLAILVVLLRPWSARSLLLFDYLTVTLNLAMITFSFALFSPDAPGIYPYCLVLFAHAAFVPCRVWFQAFLGFMPVLFYAVGQALSFNLLPETQQFWLARGGVVIFRSATLAHMIDIGILAAISVIITKTLYNYRFSLARARKLGNYLIKGEIGRGGMGTVFEATHAFLARPTAIKVMMPQGANAKESVARFEKEVRLSASLSHPNTITIFDYGHCSHYSFYYAMELLEGMDLQKFVEKFGPVPAHRAIYILKQVCGSLGEAHQSGIIHRDVKPSNIFLTKRGGLYDFVKVLDFGLAKEVRKHDEVHLTKTGAVLGTPRYVAPESIHSKGQVDERTDIYMLGSVAYWMLTGRPPFIGESSVDLIVEHLNTVPERPSRVTEMPIPEELDRIVMKCLEKDPEKRYQTPEALLEALEAVPFPSPWIQNKAREWWTLHLSPEEIVPGLKPAPELPGGEYQPAKAAAG